MRARTWMGLGQVLALGLAARVCFGETGKPARPGDEREQVAGLREEINLLNLVNGLQLTREQAGRILGFAKEAAAVREALEGKAVEHSKAMAAAFAELRGTVAKNQGIPKEVEGRASKADHELKDARVKADEKIRALEEQLLGLLDSGQLLVLANYKHCLIPTPDLKDPTRVGQAASNERPVRMLQDLRKLPAGVWEAKREDIFARHLEKVEKFLGKRSAKELEEYKEKFFATVKEARGLSDVDFELNKERLVEAVKPKDKAKEVQASLESLGAAQGKPGKAARMFFAPCGVEVLAQRLALLSEPAGQQHADLAKIKAADSCEDGKCALEGAGNLRPGPKNAGPKQP